MPTYHEKYLFDAPKACKECHRTLPKDYNEDICPQCKERILFSEIKEYIRSNDVTEFMVAEKFGIPVSRVKRWIREGRIEYKELADAPKLQTMHCTQCGAPIRFGNLCPQCQRKSNVSGAAAFTPSKDSQRFHTRENSQQK